MSASAPTTLHKPPVWYTGVVPGKGLPARREKAMLALAFLITAIAYGLAVIAWEEARP